MKKYEEAMELLDKQVGNKDGLITLSTISLETGIDGKSKPASRIVDAYYEDGTFYTVTYATSNKMLELLKNPQVAICIIVESFTADGIGENLGWVCDEKNVEMMTKLRKIFADWYYEANNDEDQNTCLLRISLTKGLWNNPHEGTKTEIDFINKVVS